MDSNGNVLENITGTLTSQDSDFVWDLTNKKLQKVI